MSLQDTVPPSPVPFVATPRYLNFTFYSCVSVMSFFGHLIGVHLQPKVFILLLLIICLFIFLRYKIIFKNRFKNRSVKPSNKVFRLLGI